jgi:endonuclease-3
MRNKRNAPRQPLAITRPKAAAKSKDASKIKPAVRPKSTDTALRRAAASKPAIKPNAGKTAASARSRTRAAASRAKPARERAPEIFARLHAAYPDAHCALDFKSPYQLLVATILSAQCTDKRVNMVTPGLFKRYPHPADLAAAKPEELEEMIKSTGFFRNKSRSLLGMSNALVEKHHGEVPSEMGQLVQLPGVGRKTANVVLGNAFGRDEGIVVDTHVARVSHRLALTTQSDPIKIEQDLMALFPRDQWTLLAHLLIEHGRKICEARRPKCEECMLTDLCPASRV